MVVRLVALRDVSRAVRLVVYLDDCLVGALVDD